MLGYETRDPGSSPVAIGGALRRDCDGAQRAYEAGRSDPSPDRGSVEAADVALALAERTTIVLELSVHFEYWGSRWRLPRPTQEERVLPSDR